MNDVSYDVFISYSTKDELFAELLERQLENYIPLTSIEGAKKLRVFRYAADMTGTDYEQAIYKHLQSSAMLLVICSPSARKSKYVDGEIELFYNLKPDNKIIPLLLKGIPNNEAQEEDEKAFPEKLFLKYKMPLAINFTTFNLRTDKVNKGFFAASWYALLSEIYSVSREIIEEREKKKVRQKRLRIAITLTTIFSIVSALAILAWIQRNTARANARVAQSHFQASEAMRLANEDVTRSAQSALLAFDLDQNYLSKKALAIAYYNQPYYQLIENLSFEGSNRLYRNSMWKQLRIDEAVNELISINADGGIRFYNNSTGKIKDSLLLTEEPQCTTPIGNHQYIIGFYNGDVRHYDRKTGKTKVLDNIKEKVSLVEANISDRLIALAKENTLVIKTIDKKSLVSFDSITGPSSITGITFVDNLIIVVFHGTQVLFYNTEKRTIEWSRQIPTLINAAFSSDTLYYITSSVSNSADSIHSLAIRTDAIWSRELDKDNSLMMSGLVLPGPKIYITENGNGLIQVWDKYGNSMGDCKSFPYGSTAITAEMNGSFLYTGDFNGQLKKWELLRGWAGTRTAGNFEKYKKEEKRRQVDQILNSIRDKKVISFFKEKISQYEGIPGSGFSTFYSLRKSDSTCTLFEVKHNKIYNSCYNLKKQLVDSVDSLELNYYGEKGCIGINAKDLVAYTGADMIIWDINAKKIISTIEIASEQVYCVDVSYNGDLIAVAFYNHISIYDETGNFLYNIPIPFASENKIEDMVFSADKKKLLTGMADGTVLEWIIDPVMMRSIIGERLRSY